MKKALFILTILLTLSACSDDIEQCEKNGFSRETCLHTLAR